MEDAFVNVDAQINEAQLWAYPCTPELDTEWVMVKFTVFGQMCLSRRTRPVRSPRRSFEAVWLVCSPSVSTSRTWTAWLSWWRGWWWRVGGLGHHEYLCQYETDRQRHNLATMVGVDCLQKLATPPRGHQSCICAHGQCGKLKDYSSLELQ